MSKSLTCSLLLLGIHGWASAQQPLSMQGSFPASGEVLSTAHWERLDPALDRIVSPDEKVVVVRAENSFGIMDGNVWVSDRQSGYLLFSDIVANVIYKLTPPALDISVFMENAGYTGSLGEVATQGYLARSGPLYVFDFGSNGLAIDPQGRLVFCSQGDRDVVRLEKDGTRTVLASQFEGKRFNRPNKLAIKSDGTIYFSDIKFGNCVNCELPDVQAIYMIKDGKISRVLHSGHGLEFSPNEKVLYTTTVKPNSPPGPNFGVIMAYDVQPDDSLTNERMFVDMSGQKEVGGPDGLAVDSAGNVYSGGPGGMWIMDPTGKHIGTLHLPPSTTNVGFGDKDLKTLYLFNRRNLLKVRLKVPGIQTPVATLPTPVVAPPAAR